MTNVVVKNMDIDTVDVQSLIDGDMQAFDRLFHRYANRLFIFSLGYVKIKEDAEGVVQDVFMKIWQQRHKINNKKSFYSFLFTIAKNHILNLIRQRSVDEKYQKYLVGNNLQVDVDSEVDTGYIELANKVNKLIELMPTVRRKVFVHSKIDGLTYKEIASKLNISVKTVESHMSLSLKFIRESMKNNSFSVMLFTTLFFPL